MIHIKKDFTIPPASLISETCQSKIKTCIDKKSYIKSDWYKKDDTKLALKEIYHNKCAYCEGYSSAQAPFQVEHYRPKDEASIKINDKKAKINGHQGYYWLAYNWSNLLWSCYWCNQKKSSLFPIENESNRIINPPLNANNDLDEDKCQSATLKSETPMLLNPEIDKPEEHFYFKRNGKIKSISKRGKATIEICQLNREDLHIARRKLVRGFSDDIRTEVADHLSGAIDFQNFNRNLNNILTKIYKRAEPENDYSRFGYFMFVKFKHFFLKKSDFDESTKEKLLEIYNEFVDSVMV